MLAVKLRYLGKTEKLVVTMSKLQKQYVFDKKTLSNDLVLYEDAKILLTDSPGSFQVVSQVMEVKPEHFMPVERDDQPESQLPFTTPEEDPLSFFDDPDAKQPGQEEEKLILTGDGVEGTGEMPPVEEPPAPPVEEPTKKGGKKGNK